MPSVTRPCNFAMHLPASGSGRYGTNGRRTQISLLPLSLNIPPPLPLFSFFSLAVSNSVTIANNP
jgi:hypothetical protein